MTSNHFLTALFAGACVLLASGLVAISLRTADTPSANAAAPTVPKSSLMATTSGTSTPSGVARAAKPLPPAEEAHESLPRLWLGSPMAR